MAASQISTSVTIINSLLGFQAISFTAMDTASALTIAAGSKVEIASAFFTFTTETTPGATSWTAVTTGNTAYVTLTPAGTAGSQTLTVDWSETAPVWSTAKQGWYASAASSVRYVGGCAKTSATGYTRKFYLPWGGQVNWASAYNAYHIPRSLIVGSPTVRGEVGSEDPWIVSARYVDDEDSGNARGFAENSDVSRSGNVAFAAFDARTKFSGANPYDHYVGFQSAPEYGATSAMTNMYGFFFRPTIASGCTITNAYGFFSSTPLGSGTVTNWYPWYSTSQYPSISRGPVFSWPTVLSGSMTQASLFTALSTAIPITSATVLVSGCYGVTDYPAIYAERASATLINLYYCNSGIQTKAITSTTSTVYVAIAWG